MNLFGDEDEVDLLNSNDSLRNALFVEILKQKCQLVSLQSAASIASNAKKMIIQKNILITSFENVQSDHVNVENIIEKLNFAKLTSISRLCLKELNKSKLNKKFDIVVLVNCISTSSQVNDLLLCLFSNGVLLLPFDCVQEKALNLFDENNWCVETATFRPICEMKYKNAANTKILTIQRRSISCNQIGAIYWSPMNDVAKHEKRIRNERKLIEDITVHLTVDECCSGTFSEHSHNRAVHNLKTHGLCIFPGLFDRKEVLSWGRVAKQDMKELLHVLKRKKNIDLLHPEREGGSFIENFFELSMREALRCDIRNCIGLNLKNGSNLKNYSNLGASNFQECEIQALNDNNNKKNVQNNIRHHPAIMQVLQEAMNPKPTEEVLMHGNWGRWNFEGKGPAVIQFPVSGKVGSIFTFEGCADQTIHADTSHLFLNSHLPPHYVNLFVPAVETSKKNNENVNDNDDDNIDYDNSVYLKFGDVLQAFGGDGKKNCKTLKSNSHSSKKNSGCILNKNAVDIREKPGEEKEEKTKKEESIVQGFEIGQTAFVVGSQHLKVSYDVMMNSDDAGQEELESRLVRPHLKTGDALLFDCRILHFGLANVKNKLDKSLFVTNPNVKYSNIATINEENESVYDLKKINKIVDDNIIANKMDEKKDNEDEDEAWRPMMYVNYHHDWFVDPKNWNDKEKLVN